MLYLIGLGLWNENDLSLRAIEAAKSCESVYMETYTANWEGNTEHLESLLGKKIFFLEREEVESDFLTKKAKNEKVALLVPGDPLAATTHFELFYECRKQDIECRIIHASSIYAAVALTGLQIYKFGRSTTLPKPAENFKPESHYEVILENKKAGLHTLVLLDTKDRGMTIKEGLQLLTEIEGKRNGDVLKEKIIVATRMGSENPMIKYGSAKNLMINESPGIIIIPGSLNFKEEEYLELWK